jgi:hypothetical protein
VHYTSNALRKIETEFSKIRFKYYDLIRKLGAFAAGVSNTRAREYINNGVTRRLFVIYRCLENIFALFPPNRAERLADEARMDLEINLHAFLINIYGIIENLGMALALENGLLENGRSEKESKNEIGLFKKDFRKKLSTGLRKYLLKSKVGDWYNAYAKNFRDALAHRIPPYVPPSGLNKDDQIRFQELNEKLATLSKQGYSEQYSAIMEELVNLGKASPFYVHSFTERSKLVYIHPQIIADFMTLEEIIEKVLEDFYVPSKSNLGK